MSFAERKEEMRELNLQSVQKMPDKVVQNLFAELGIDPMNKEAVRAKNEVLETTEGQDVVRNYNNAFQKVQATDREEMAAYQKGNEEAAIRMLKPRRWFQEKYANVYDHFKERLKAKLDMLADGKPGRKELLLFTDKYSNRYVYDVPLTSRANTPEVRRNLQKVMGLETQFGEGKELLDDAKKRIRSVVYKPGEYLDEVGFILMPLHEKMEQVALNHLQVLEKNPNALDGRIEALQDASKTKTGTLTGKKNPMEKGYAAAKKIAEAKDTER